MDDFILTSRALIAVGLTLLLALLRLDAERFGTAEYYEVNDAGEQPRLRRRLAWYGLGFGIAILILTIHPSARTDLFLGPGDRLGAVLGGVAFGGLGALVAAGFANYRYHRIRLPAESSYPGALLNSTATAFVDEVAFRGALFGLLLTGGVDPTLANLLQTVVYALTTRLGRSRPRSVPARPDPRDRLPRRMADRPDRRDRRVVPGSRRDPLRRLPVHRAHRSDDAARSRGRGDRAAPPDARGLERDRVPGAGLARSVSTAPAPAVATWTAPPAGLYVHVPFCVSLCPYCDFVVLAGGATRGPRTRIPAFLAALRTEVVLRADALDAAFVDGREPLETIYLGGGTPSLLPADVVAELLDLIRARFGLAPGAEVTIESNPGPRRTR